MLRRRHSPSLITLAQDRNAHQPMTTTACAPPAAGGSIIHPSIHPVAVSLSLSLGPFLRRFSPHQASLLEFLLGRAIHAQHGMAWHGEASTRTVPTKRQTHCLPNK